MSARCASTIELDITAVDQRTLDSVKRQLLRKINEISDQTAKPVVIADKFIAEISDECKRDILSLESTDVEITIGG